MEGKQGKENNCNEIHKFNFKSDKDRQKSDGADEGGRRKQSNIRSQLDQEEGAYDSNSDDEKEYYPDRPRYCNRSFDNKLMNSDISSVSSSPPNDFNIESQYIPIFTDESDLNEYQHEHLKQLHSSASSLSMTSASPVVLQSTNGRLLRCPVCEKPMRTFYCARCIQQGSFITNESARLKYVGLGYDTVADGVVYISEKQRMRYNLPSLPECRAQDDSQANFDVQHGQRSEIKPTSKETNETIKLEETLQSRLRALVKKISNLELLRNEGRLKYEQTQRHIGTSIQQLEQEKKMAKSNQNKLELMKRLLVNRKASVEKRHTTELELVDRLQQHLNRRVFQLTNDIFPIEEINPLEQSSPFVNMETSPLLTFSDGSHHQIEQQTALSIVEPWLPSDGDYSAYSLWVNDNKDHMQISERNPASRIGAALSYANQLVKNLATYLDVILPAKQEITTFNGELLGDREFSYNVAKLNVNIVHICVSQGIEVSLLNPQKTLKNLMMLLDLNICDLGKRTTVDLTDSEESVKRIEDLLTKDLSLVQDEYYDFSKYSSVDDGDEDVIDSEWEISETVNTTEIQMANEASIQQNSLVSRLPLSRLFASFLGSTER